MSTIPTLSKSTCARLPLRNSALRNMPFCNAALMGIFFGVLLLALVSSSIHALTHASSLGFMDETIYA